ncbi:MAG: hypothetical protein ACTSU3_00685 [Candidatus Thorarchaeota archaeon]
MIMRVRIQDQEIPFPLTTIRGRLRLSGLGDVAISKILSDIKKNQSTSQKIPTESDLTKFVEDALHSESPLILKSYETLNTYEHLRSVSDEIPPIILALEGASATGKSMLAIELVNDLAATRFISTDTVRQVLRGIYSKKDHPELYCHTYQAFKHKQSGSRSLDSVVRGYIAQCELANPYVIEIVKRIHAEGATAVIEGVHLQPGLITNLTKGTLEILINPSEQTHKAMFTSKYVAGKLKSVSKDPITREEEFQSTRKIQDYMHVEAKKHDLSIIELESYEDARSVISKLIINKIELILGDHQ